MTTPLRYIFAFYPDSLADVRKPSVALEVQKLGTPSSLHVEDDPLRAIADALNLSEPGEHEVYIIGALRDIKVPDGIDEKLWKQSIIHVIEDRGITFIPLDVTKRSLAQLTGTRSEIRAYYEVREHLKGEIDRRIRRTVMGRPPYGYRVIDGVLQIDPHYRRTIRSLIQDIKKGKTPTQILEHMEETYGTEPDRRPKAKRGALKKQFWGYQKLRRIFNRLRLYTLGEYSAADGQFHVDTSLAFLPAEWADLEWPIKPPDQPPVDQPPDQPPTNL